MGLTEDGYALARVARALILARGESVAARAFAEAQYGATSLPARLLAKNVLGTSNIIGDVDAQTASAAFIALARRGSLIEAINSIVPFAKVPFDVPFLAEGTGATAFWTQESKPIKTSSEGFVTSRLPVLKIAALVVLTIELLKLIGPTSDAMLNRSLMRAANLLEGTSFIDPANAGTAGIEPASITHGAPSTPSTGSSAAAIAADIEKLAADFTGDLGSAVWLLSPATGITLALMGASVGALNLGIGSTGYLVGLPAVCHAAVPAGLLVLLDPAGIAITERVLEVDASTQSTVEVEDDQGGASSFVSLWQLDLVAARLRQYVNWQRVNDGAVSVLTGFPAA
ncbi:phage major capsid protein [Paraburkholderia sp. SIMBA_049]